MIRKIFKSLLLILKIIFFISWKETLTFLRNALSKPKIKKLNYKSIKKYVVSNDTLSKNFHEPHFEKIVQLLVSKGDNCLDLGAYIGIHSIIMSKRVKESGQIFSFEPDSLVFSLMQLNLLQNKIENVKAYKLAVLNKTAECIKLSDFDYSSKNINLGIRSIEKKKNYNSGNLCASIQIDELKLPKIDFVKIDIQGSEYLALLGMRKKISIDKPIFFIEIEEFYLNKMNTSKKKLTNFFKDRNYVLFQIQTKFPVDFLCIPAEKLYDFKKNFIKKFSYPLKEV